MPEYSPSNRILMWNDCVGCFMTGEFPWNSVSSYIILELLLTAYSYWQDNTCVIYCTMDKFCKLVQILEYCWVIVVFEMTLYFVELWLSWIWDWWRNASSYVILEVLLSDSGSCSNLLGPSCFIILLHLLGQSTWTETFDIPGLLHIVLLSMLLIHAYDITKCFMVDWMQIVSDTWLWISHSFGVLNYNIATK